MSDVASPTMAGSAHMGAIAAYWGVLQTIPYVVRRRVRWADCDAGGIVYTAHFLDYAIETAESWFESVTGTHWSRLAPDFGLGHPFVNCTLNFRHMLRCHDDFDMEVAITDIRRSAYVMRIVGRNRDRRDCFEAALTAAFISFEPPRSLPIPEPFRERIESYRRMADSRAVQ